MIPRARRLDRLSRQFPVVALVGARQVGKSTLARAFAERSGGAADFDLEDPRDLARLREPLLALDPLRGLVVLDEIQRRPDLFPVLRVLADRPRRPARFLILGSTSGDLLRQGSESLAGTFVVLELQPRHENLAKRQVKSPKGLCRGQRASPRAPGPFDAPRSARLPEGRRLVGGLRRPADRREVGGVPAQLLLLGAWTS